MKIPNFLLLKAFLISATSLISCSIGKQGVCYNEMGKKPSIETYDYKIIVHTHNSIKNSALLIYKIDLYLDTINRTISLRGFQALSKDSKNRFELETKNLKKGQLNYYNYFWIDPDNNKTQIEEIKK